LRRALAVALFLPSLAAGQEVRFLGGIDFFAVNPPNATGLEEGELGFAVRGDVRGIAGKLDLRLDYRDREVLVSDGDVPSRHELHDLSLTARDLGGRVDLTVGRFPVPGGFWLITDGGAARVRLGPFSIMGYGGLRSFTGGRDDADFAGVVLPLAGGAVTVDHPIIHASLSYTWTQDQLSFYRGNDITQSTTQDEMFLDGQLMILPHPSLLIAGGATLGTRYELVFSSMTAAMSPAFNFTSAPSVDARPLSSFMAYAIVEWRPIRRLRLSYAFDFDRVQIAVTQLPLANQAGAAGGSFEDHTVKASWRFFRNMRIEARYRLRFRENTDVIHRGELGVTGDDIIGGFGAFVTVGADYYQFDRANAPADRNLYTASGGLSFIRRFFDVRAGVLYTDAIGSGFAWSQHAQQAMGSGPFTELFPLTLEGQRITFLRAFIAWRGFFGGLDAEVNLDASQARVFVQAGWAR